MSPPEGRCSLPFRSCCDRRNVDPEAGAGSRSMPCGRGCGSVGRGDVAFTPDPLPLRGGVVAPLPFATAGTVGAVAWAVTAAVAARLVVDVNAWWRCDSDVDVYET